MVFETYESQRPQELDLPSLNILNISYVLNIYIVGVHVQEYFTDEAYDKV